jgi:RNA binding exosome subunit
VAPDWPRKDQFVIGVEISVFAHATEDEGKVERALRNVIPPELAGFRVDRRGMRGHYNDPITLITARIRRKKEATETFRATMASLSSLDRYRLIEEIDDRVDEAGNLYLRLDKQRALGGAGVLNEVDPIRIKFRFQVPHSADPVAFIRSSVTAVIDEAGYDATGRNRVSD